MLLSFGITDLVISDILSHKKIIENSHEHLLKNKKIFQLHERIIMYYLFLK